MTNLINFTNDKFGSIRTIEIEGKPYFMANDVAKALVLLDKELLCMGDRYSEVVENRAFSAGARLNLCDLDDYYEKAEYKECTNDDEILDKILYKTYIKLLNNKPNEIDTIILMWSRYDSYSTFEENIKYCPFCGKELIRYAKPKFIEEINWNWLDEYESVVEKMYRELEYIIYCKLDKEQIDELEEKSARGMEYFGQDRWSFPYSKGTVCDIIHRIARTKVHYTEKRKLEKEFGGLI